MATRPAPAPVHQPWHTLAIGAVFAELAIDLALLSGMFLTPHGYTGPAATANVIAGGLGLLAVQRTREYLVTRTRP